MSALPSARRRLGLLTAFFALELVVAWVLAAPFAELAARVLGNHPDGDKVAFWTPGMHLLFDLGMQHGVALRALVGGTAIGLVVWWALSIFLEGALFAGLAEEGELRAPRLGERTFGLAARMVGLAAIALIGTLVLVLLCGVFPISTMMPKLDGATPRASVLALALPVLFTAFVLATFKAFVDLVAALCTRRDCSLGAALALALRAPKRVLALTGLALPRWIAAAGLLGFGAAFSTGSRSVFAIFVAHQALAFGRVALRGSVIARALRVADSMPVAEGAG